MALAIATGVPPQHGLYTAIVAGALIALLGGSRCQVSGPTAAYVAILLPIVHAHGLAGLMIASCLAGVFLIAMGLLRLGRYIQFVPEPVVTGFTTGIGITIATSQLANILGLRGVEARTHWHEILHEDWLHRTSISPWDFGIGLATLLLLVFVPRVTTKVPAPLVAIGLAAVGAWLLRTNGIAEPVTIASKFGYWTPDGTRVAGIPPWPPHFAWPWDAPGPGGTPLMLDWDAWRMLLFDAVAISLLGALESLLAAVVADGMTGTRHDPDAELVAQGVGNVVAPLFGGFAATGAIARTATNIKSGARSPIAAIVHAGFLLLAMVSLAPVLGELPIAAMAALLLMVAWRMADVRHFADLVRTAPRGDVVVLLTCCGLTVVFDMVVGVIAGMGLATMVFLRDMSRTTASTALSSGHPDLGMPIPPGVLVYAIEGPLFFGAAERALNALRAIGRHGGVVVLDVEDVPTVDATGLANLRSVLHLLQKDGARVVLTGVHVGLRFKLEKARLVADDVHVFEQPKLRDGVAFAAALVQKPKATVRS